MIDSSTSGGVVYTEYFFGDCRPLIDVQICSVLGLFDGVGFFGAKYYSCH
jgi:hypothetical protein